MHHPSTYDDDGGGFGGTSLWLSSLLWPWPERNAPPDHPPWCVADHGNPDLGPKVCTNDGSHFPSKRDKSWGPKFEYNRMAANTNVVPTKYCRHPGHNNTRQTGKNTVSKYMKGGQSVPRPLHHQCQRVSVSSTTRCYLVGDFEIKEEHRCHRGDDNGEARRKP